MIHWNAQFRADLDNIFGRAFLNPTPHVAALANYLKLKLTTREVAFLRKELSKGLIDDDMAAPDEERTEA